MVVPGGFLVFGDFDREFFSRRCRCTTQKCDSDAGFNNGYEDDDPIGQLKCLSLGCRGCVCDRSRLCQRPCKTSGGPCRASTFDDGTLRVDVEALDGTRQRRRLLFLLGVVSSRYDVSFGSCRYGMRGGSCFRPRVSTAAMAVVGDCLGGGNFANLLSSFFLGCSRRAFVRSGSLLADFGRNETESVAELNEIRNYPVGYRRREGRDRLYVRALTSA